MAKDNGERNEKPRRTEFKPDIKSATAIIGAIAFLEKAGFSATPKNIKTCIVQRTHKPAGHIMEHLPNYLSRGLELGILRRLNGSYRLGKFSIRKRRKKIVKNRAKRSSPIQAAKDPAVTASMSKKSSVCEC